MKASNLICPISSKKIDNNTSRITAGLVASVLLLFIITGSPLFLMLVMSEFFVKVFFKSMHAPMHLIADTVVKQFGWTGKKIDEAPKIFSSRMGLLVTLVSGILLVSGFTIASYTTAILLVSMASLHAIFNYCVGCVIYHFLVLPYAK